MFLTRNLIGSLKLSLISPARGNLGLARVYG